MSTPTVAFFALAYVWTWAWQAPLVAGYQGPLWLVFLGMAAIGPSLAAIVLTRGRILRQLRPHARWGWFAVAAALPLAVRGLALLVDGAFGHALPDPLVQVPALGAMLLPALGEELGWRGFAFPQLADRLGAASAAVITGLAWGLWHLPTALMPDASLGQFPVYLLMVTAGGIWMAWLYQAAGRCTVVAIVAHAAINCGLVARGTGPGMVVVWVAVGAVALFALTRMPRQAAA